MRLLIALFFAAVCTVVAAQPPQVPDKMQFADITLTIRDDAKREIQKDVDAFTRYAPSFNAKVERARTYFPIIEKIFAEENVPDDFKYLVIQESALIADAVSVSNAVGFWQFKDFTAMEMGLRVDKEIDERMNIVSASRAAARYFKKNNMFFDNWLFALQAYQMGAGGVMRSEKENQNGAKHMEINSHTYWYVKKYLAHRIAYENAVKGSGKIQVISYQTKLKRTLADLAKETAVDETELKNYNKWSKSGVIPDDRSYTVLIPVVNNARVNVPQEEVIASAGDGNKTVAVAANSSVAYAAKEIIKINGISAVKALAGESPAKVSKRADVDLVDFLKWNDISIGDQILPGKYYLLGKKRARATEAYHKLQPGESLWSVSQQYGVKIKKLKRYNRISSEQELKPGTTLWLSSMKPKSSDKIVTDASVAEVDKGAAFGWEEGTTAAVVTIPKTQPQEVKVSSPDPANTETEETPPKPVVVQDSAAVLPQQVVSTVTEPNVQIEETVVVTEKKTEHVVQPKETLYAIARQYNIGVMDLVNWNGLDLQQGIKPGQILKLTDPASIEEQSKTDVKTSTTTAQVEHEVKPTDTVYSIARKYGVTIKELMEWNNKKDFTLAVGEKLKVITRQP